MKQSFYGERDYASGQAMLSLRAAMGLTQASLATLLGVSRKAISRWEAGESYPKAEHLKALLELAVEQQAFPVDSKEEKIRAFWQAAHQKVLIDDTWLAALLAHQGISSASRPVSKTSSATSTLASSVHSSRPRMDRSDAPAITAFYGRERELSQLATWIVQERCRVVSILGLGGIGKSALASRAMQHVAEHFEVVIWRSLRDAPTCEALLGDCLQTIAPQALRDAAGSLERLLNLLLTSLRNTRTLLILDNMEVLLEEGQSTGHMRPGYEGYARLLHDLAQAEHQSCLLITSREKPDDLIPHEGSKTPVHVLRLMRLNTDSCKQLLAEKEVVGSAGEQERLIEAYTGNPLALKIVTQTILDLFDGYIAPFLEQGEIVFGGVRVLLSQQYDRLSAVEQTVLLWLAVVREPMSIEELLAMLGTPLPRIQILEAVEALRRRSLIEQGQRPGSFMLQAVVLEYVTTRLIAEVASEIKQQRPRHLIEQGLELAIAKEYVRLTQMRLIVAPLLVQLQSMYQGKAVVEEHLLALLQHIRARPDDAQGYGPANILVLLRELRGHLRGLDLAHLAIRGAYLHNVDMQDASLVGARLRETILNEAFDIPWSVAISSDGQYWAVGSRRGEARLWREGGKHLHLVWQAHTDTLRALAFSPDGGTLATGSWDGSIKLWNVASGALLWTHWFTDNIECLAFAPDGHILACGGDDATIQLWDTRTGVQRHTLSGLSGPVFALAWSPAGHLIAGAGIDADIRLWNLASAEPATPIQKLVGHTNWVLGLAFTPDGSMLASGSWDGTVKVWSVLDGRLCHTLAGHTDRVRAVTWSLDGRLLASCGFDQTIWLWDSEHGSYRAGLHGHNAGVYDLAFTPDSRSLLSGSEDGTLRVWEIERGQCIYILQGYAVSLYDIAWSPDATYIASAGSDQLVTIWETNGRTPPRLLHGHRSLVSGVAWHPAGKLLVSSSLDNTIRLWDTATGEMRQSLQHPDYSNTLFYGVAWSPDGTQLALASYQQGIMVWEIGSETQRWVSQAQSTRIRRVAWSPDGALLASCGDDGSICLWNASDGQLRASLQGHQGMVMSIAWSPDGTQLASAGGSRGNGEIFLWDAHDGKYLQRWEEPGAIVNALAWKPAGKILLSGGSDGALCWRDVQRGTLLTRQRVHQGAIHALKASPDGLKLASCGDDNIVQIWDLQSGTHLQTLRRDRPYERLNITGIRGLPEVQKTSLRALGAFWETGM